MGVAEEAGKAAQSTISALSSTPVVLALVIFNVLYMGGTFWTQNKQAQTYDQGASRWKEVVESAMSNCIPRASEK